MRRNFFSRIAFKDQISAVTAAEGKWVRVNSVEKRLTGRTAPVRTDDPNAQIAMKLRSFYLSVQEEAIPQRFLDLLDKLDAVESGMQRAD